MLFLFRIFEFYASTINPCKTYFEILTETSSIMGRQKYKELGSRWFNIKTIKNRKLWLNDWSIAKTVFLKMYDGLDEIVNLLDGKELSDFASETDKAATIVNYIIGYDKKNNSLITDQLVKIDRAKLLKQILIAEGKVFEVVSKESTSADNLNYHYFNLIFNMNKQVDLFLKSVGVRNSNDLINISGNIRSEVAPLVSEQIIFNITENPPNAIPKLLSAMEVERNKLEPMIDNHVITEIQKEDRAVFHSDLVLDKNKQKDSIYNGMDDSNNGPMDASFGSKQTVFNLIENNSPNTILKWLSKIKGVERDKFKYLMDEYVISTIQKTSEKKVPFEDVLQPLNEIFNRKFGLLMPLGRENIKVINLEYDDFTAQKEKLRISKWVLKDNKKRYKQRTLDHYQMFKVELNIDGDIKIIKLLLEGKWISKTKVNQTEGIRKVTQGKSGKFLIIEERFLEKTLNMIASAPKEIIGNTNLKYVLASPYTRNNVAAAYAIRSTGLINVFMERESQYLAVETGSGMPVLHDWPGVFGHELGHLLTMHIDYDEWMEAMKQDNIPTTSYPYEFNERRAIRLEDIAETVRFYASVLGGVLNPKFLRDYANRFKLIDKAVKLSPELRNDFLQKARDLIIDYYEETPENTGKDLRLWSDIRINEENLFIEDGIMHLDLV